MIRNDDPRFVIRTLGLSSRRVRQQAIFMPATSEITAAGDPSQATFCKNGSNPSVPVSFAPTSSGGGSSHGEEFAEYFAGLPPAMYLTRLIVDLGGDGGQIV
jgi:hypothetical protein